jgi:hypothetical protein
MFHIFFNIKLLDNIIPKLYILNRKVYKKRVEGAL